MSCLSGVSAASAAPPLQVCVLLRRAFITVVSRPLLLRPIDKLHSRRGPVRALGWIWLDSRFGLVSAWLRLDLSWIWFAFIRIIALIADSSNSSHSSL